MAACYGSLRKPIQSPEQNSDLKLKVLSPRLSVSKAELLISYKYAQIGSLLLMEYGHTHTHTHTQLCHKDMIVLCSHPGRFG